MNEALIIGLLAACVIFDAWIICVLSSIHNEAERIRLILSLMAAKDDTKAYWKK